MLAGAKGYKSEQVFDEIRRLKLSSKVKYIGYVTHNQKMELLKHAACFVFPSSYEWFGLPVLEALAFGTPVITSNISSLTEVAGSAALLVEPEKEASIAAALKKLLTSPGLQASLRKKGPTQAKRFSWETCARETIKVYQGAGK